MLFCLAVCSLALPGGVDFALLLCPFAGGVAAGATGVAAALPFFAGAAAGVTGVCVGVVGAGDIVDGEPEGVTFDGALP